MDHVERFMQNDCQKHGKWLVYGYKCSDDHVTIRLKGNIGIKTKHWLCECDPSISR